MNNDSNLNKNKFLIRLKLFEEKSSLNNNKKFKHEIDYEKELIKKYKENSSNIEKTVKSTKNIINDKINKEIKKLEDMKTNVCKINQMNIEIKNKIIINEIKVEDYLISKLSLAEKKLNEIYNEILISRKKNFNTFDNRVNFYYKSNKSIRSCKKKLYLLMNFLRLKIIYKRFSSENINQLKLDETNVTNLGYFINIEKNRIKPIMLSESLDEVSKTKYFWNTFCENFRKDF